MKTNHQSLKFLLEQRITFMLQQKWLTKLLGLNYDIVYKKGVDNRVANFCQESMNKKVNYQHYLLYSFLGSLKFKLL